VVLGTSPREKVPGYALLGPRRLDETSIHEHKSGPSAQSVGKSFAEKVMSRVCVVTGKRAMKGNKVSHSNHKSIKRTQPNLQDKRFWLGSENRWIRLRLSVAAMRQIDKLGIDSIVRDLRANGVAV